MKRLVVVLAAACAPQAVYEPPPEAPAPARQQGDTLLRINLDALCHAERAADAVSVPVAERLAYLERYLIRQLSHDSVRGLRERAWAASPGKRADILRAGARELGMIRCPLADLLDWLARAGRSGCAEACISRLHAHDDIALSADCRLGCRDVVP